MSNFPLLRETRMKKKNFYAGKKSVRVPDIIIFSHDLRGNVRDFGQKRLKKRSIYRFFLWQLSQKQILNVFENYVK